MGRKAWSEPELRWGIWGSAESELRLCSDLEPGNDIIELGSGTAVVSAWLSQRGMKPVAVDFSRRQTRNVEGLQREQGLSFRALCENAERVPFEADSFDVAISEYGASLWCDPERWLLEAHRLLRPHGRLILFTTSPFLWTCTPAHGGTAGKQLVRDYFSDDPSGKHIKLDPSGAVEFRLTHSGWVRLLRAYGFVLDDLVEITPSADVRPRFDFATFEWARHWPSEDVWIVRKPGPRSVSSHS